MYLLGVRDGTSPRGRRHTVWHHRSIWPHLKHSEHFHGRNHCFFFAICIRSIRLFDPFFISSADVQAHAKRKQFQMFSVNGINKRNGKKGTLK